MSLDNKIKEVLNSKKRESVQNIGKPNSGTPNPILYKTGQIQTKIIDEDIVDNADDDIPEIDLLGNKTKVILTPETEVKYDENDKPVNSKKIPKSPKKPVDGPAFECTNDHNISDVLYEMVKEILENKMFAKESLLSIKPVKSNRDNSAVREKYLKKKREQRAAREK